MIEVNLEIKGEDEKTIDFPNCYEDLTYRQYIDINKIMLKDIEPKLRDRKIIAYLLKIDEEMIGNILVDTYNQLLNQLFFLTEEIPVTDEITELYLDNELYVRRDINTFTINEQEFLSNIKNVYGLFESLPYYIGVLFTKPGEENKIIKQEDLDRINKIVQDIPFVDVYNVFFSSSNLKQLSTKNLVSYFKQQMNNLEKEIEEQT